jgi:hypothetical protein
MGEFIIPSLLQHKSDHSLQNAENNKNNNNKNLRLNSQNRHCTNITNDVKYVQTEVNVVKWHCKIFFTCFEFTYIMIIRKIQSSYENSMSNKCCSSMGET